MSFFRHGPLAAACLLLLLRAGGLGAADLTIGMTQYPSTFHPSIDSMLAKTMVLSMTQRPLTTHDHDWQPICRLCTDYPTFENGLVVAEDLADGKKGAAVTYRLQPAAIWGDGTPVTSADAVFTWEVGRHPQSGISNAELYRRILSVEVIDLKTFTLHLDRIEFKTGSADDFHLLPAHIERPIFEADPTAYRNRTAFDSDPTNPALAFGPYRLAEIVPGASITLTRNSTWWGRRPAFDKVTFKIIENTAALEANLLSGGIDMISGELGLTLDQAIAFEKRHGEDYEVLYKAGLLYEHIDLNLGDPILADVRVRRALLHALDRQAINDKLFDGRQPSADTSVSPLDWIHSGKAVTYPYDPARAAALLDEAGWSSLTGGIRHNADGVPLTLEIMTTAGNRSRELVQQVLQSQWRAAGIDVRIRNEPARVFFGETVRKRNFSQMAMFAWSSSPENVPRTTMHSDQVPTAENGWSGQNYTGYNSPAMDALLDKLEVELDADKRAPLWAELQRLYSEDLPALPLYWRANSYILPRWLKGVRPTGHQGVTTQWIETWTSEGR